MRILLFGATGMVGQRILKEALDRGHEVTAVTRNPAGLPAAPRLTARECDVLNADAVAELARGQDVIVSAVGPPHGSSDYSVVVNSAHALIAAAQRAGVRLVVVGGAGSLEVAPGVQLVDTPYLPAEWKESALAHREALGVYRTAPPDADWTYVSPAAFTMPGERTGKFRLGGDQLVADATGQSRISCEDLAIAILDEVENPQHRRQRFTAAY